MMPSPFEPDGPLPEAGVYRAGWPVFRLPGWLLRLAWRHRHVSIPLGAPLGMLAAGALLARHHPGLVTPGAIALAADVMMWFTAERKWDTGPRWHGWRWTSEVAYARATVIAGGVWLVLAGDIGPLAHGMGWLLALGAAAWGIPFWLHKRPRDRRARKRHARKVAQWDGWWQSHAGAWGAGGSRVIDITERGALETLLIQMMPGIQSAASLKSRGPLIESALGGYVAHGMTRIEVNKANPSQARVHLKRDDPLREEIGWDDSMAPDDITLPAPLGVRESGKWLRACLRASAFIIGRSRSGKSNELSVKLATITRCRNARVLLIDMKGGRAARPWLPAIEWLATTTDEADLVLQFAMAEAKARGALAYNGTEQLHPTEEVPTLFLVIDETYEVTSAMSGSPGAERRAGWLATISSQGQGVEVYTIVLTQYGGLAESVGTEQTRLNLNRRFCFQTEERKHGAFALGDDCYSLADTTSLREKGTFYYRADSETMPEQIRGPHISHDLVRQIAVRNAERTGMHDRPLRLYASDWQEIYDRRWERLPAGFHRDAPQAAHIAPSPAAGGQPVNKINISAPPVDDEVSREVAAINADVDEMPGTDADIARAAALRAARGAPPVDLASEGDHRRRLFASLLQGAAAEPGQSPEGISPAQLKQGCGMGRTWTHRQLSALMDAGVVAKVGDGRYVPLGDIWEAMEAIRTEGDRLVSVAREMAGASK